MGYNSVVEIYIDYEMNPGEFKGFLVLTI